MIARGKIVASALALLGGAGVISVATSQEKQLSQSQTQTQTYQSETTTKTPAKSRESETTANPKSPVVTTKKLTETESIPFETESYNDPSLPEGQTRVDSYGENGTLTNTYEVTYTDGAETSRKLISSVRTVEPTNKVIAIGTYVAPAPQPASPSPSYTQPSGSGDTYVNSAGNTVESPNSNPSGATALCRDGTYSHSQSRRGTCSRHGGVAQWL